MPRKRSFLVSSFSSTAQARTQGCTTAVSKQTAKCTVCFTEATRTQHYAVSECKSKASLLRISARKKSLLKSQGACIHKTSALPRARCRIGAEAGDPVHASNLSGQGHNRNKTLTPFARRQADESFFGIKRAPHPATPTHTK